MTAITDEFMREMMGRTKHYAVVVVKAGPNLHMPGVESIIREHARRNFLLREQGILSIVMPISDGSPVHGVGVFNAEVEKVRGIMDEDPGVMAGVFVYEVHQSRSFPGDCLPGQLPFPAPAPPVQGG